MNGEFPWVIVGSGPSGCAAAESLVRRGIVPIILDGGIEARREVSQSGIGTRAEPGKKAWFGSVASYAQPDAVDLAYAPEVLARASFGLGGFSRVWGGTVDLPEDWSSWPIDARPDVGDLQVLSAVLPQAETAWGDDAIREGFRVPGAPAAARAMRLFQRASEGGRWDVRASRVAIQTGDSSPRPCQPCGRCLSGCERDAIWFAGEPILTRAREGVVDYRPGVIVRRVEELDDSAVLHVLWPDGSTGQITAGRVLIGAGAISSAAIAVSSHVADSLVLRDTGTAFTAAISMRAEVKGSGLHHGLSNWWIKDRHDQFMAQVYPPTEEHADRLASRMPGGSHWLYPARVLARQLHPIVAYQAVADSDSLVVEWVGGQVGVRIQSSLASRAAFVSRLSRLSRAFRKAGYLLPVSSTEFSPAGTGYHSGASLPHGVGTDALGRPHGMRRTHFIDATVLPAISVGSMTPTVMVNAIRIARQCVEEGAA